MEMLENKGNKKKEKKDMPIHSPKDTQYSKILNVEGYISSTFHKICLITQNVMHVDVS